VGDVRYERVMASADGVGEFPEISEENFPSSACEIYLRKKEVSAF